VYRTFLQDYNRHGDSQIFDATKLNVRQVGKSFGFDTPPRVEMKTVVEVKVDKNARPYGPEKLYQGKKRKA
jgi:ATP-dependent RNA helicase DDX18/HAS1